MGNRSNPCATDSLPHLAVSLLLVCTVEAAVSQTPADGQTPADSTGATLQDFLSAAIEYSPRLGIAEENLNIQAAREDAAAGQLLPQISASASVTENRRETSIQDEKFRGERYSLQLTQVVFNWEAFAAQRRARHIQAAHEAEYSFELSLLLTRVADHYLNVLQAQDALESIQAELDAVTLQVEQIQSLFDRQLAPITDLRQAQAGLSSVRAEQIRLRSELDLAQEALRAASGLPAGELHTLSEDAEVPQLKNDIQYWVGLALEKNLQIEASRLSVKAAERGVSQGKGALMPNLSLIAQRQESNVGFDNAPIRRTDTSYIGISATMPLYSGGTRWAAIREARSTHALAERELSRAELDASERVRAAYLQLQSSGSLIEAATAVVVATTLATEAMQQGFALGTVTHVDVLQAIRDRFRAERDLQQARYDSIRYFVLLKHESGTLTPDDMAAVSSWFDKPGS